MAAITEKNGKILDGTTLCNHCNTCEAWMSKREIGEDNALQLMDFRIKR